MNDIKSLALVQIAAGLLLVASGCENAITVTREITEYKKPQSSPLDLLQDDRLEDKVTKFDPLLVHRKPLGDWLVNLSDAVTKLDVPMIRPDQDERFLVLHPSYKAAVEANDSMWNATVIPSVNLLDGKAKQFDDGLYAALDQAYFEGLEGTFVSHIDIVRRIFDKLGPDSEAAPFLAAGLQLADISVEVTNASEKHERLQRFLSQPTASKPISFYTWNKSLQQCFQFMRFFQQPFDARNIAIPLAIARVLGEDDALLDDYNKANEFYAWLTNPLKRLTIADLVGTKSIDTATLTRLANERKVEQPRVALFPESSSRESHLFTRLFANGPLPPDANLMRELISRIQSMEIDLRPSADAGWYDYQVYALETMLLPERGLESNKLLLTRPYKKRMLESFKALVTKRRETHVRQFGDAAGGIEGDPPPEPDEVKPRLRVEPCPSYYVRTARAYSFLFNMLESTIGASGMKSLHGLRRDGMRKTDLHTELALMRDLFYGLYLVSAEDIGMEAIFLKDESVDEERCYRLASNWLANAFDWANEESDGGEPSEPSGDQDLTIDTRVSIPIYYDPISKKTRLWITLGVRMSKLDATYARPLRIKAENVQGKWRKVDSWKLKTAHYLIPVDEFAEVEVPGNVALTRDELRQLCDKHKTKEAITSALGRLVSD